MQKPSGELSLSGNSFRKWAIVLVSVLCLQIVYGAFTSGMKAGYGFNTYPLMGGELMPEALFFQHLLFGRILYPINFLFSSSTAGWEHAWQLVCYTSVGSHSNLDI